MKRYSLNPDYLGKARIYDSNPQDISVNKEYGVKPLGFRLLVKTKSKDELKKQGSLYIPDAAADKEAHRLTIGVIVDMGARAFEDFSEKPEIGDKVAFKAYHATFANDEGDLRYVADSDIMGVLA